MIRSRQHITVFEHDSISLNDKFENGVVFDKPKLEAFEKFFGKGKPYFSLIRNGLQFNEYVGAIQVGNTLVEVLPKADKRKTDASAKNTWREVLINMLRVVHGFTVNAPTSSHLKIRNNSVLDLYFELFVNEVEYLLYRGLVKKYHQKQGNLLALKGRFLFNKHISKNLIHKERFFTQYTAYDTEHMLHIIIYQTLLVLKRINTKARLVSRINAILLNFPEMPQHKINERSFENIKFNRKTKTYEQAIKIARLILLQYHPDISKGSNDVLALMFDMNLLWEQFVLVSLKKNRSIRVKGQNSKYFWKPEGGRRRSIRPDITVFDGENNFVLDTKWKLVDRKPSMDDIRQMYVYHHYFNAAKVALLYPGVNGYISGKYTDADNHGSLSDNECGLMFTEFNGSVKKWQEQIGEEVMEWIKK